MAVGSGVSVGSTVGVAVTSGAPITVVALSLRLKNFWSATMPSTMPMISMTTAQIAVRLRYFERSRRMRFSAELFLMT